MPTKPRSVFSFRYGVFDNDGTLVDSIPFCGGIFADVVSTYGIPRAAAVEYYSRTTGKPMREQYRGILEAFDVDFGDEDVESLRKTFDRRFLALDVKFFPFARRALASLARTQRLFLSSAAPDAAVWKRLNAGDAAKHFTVAYGSSAVPKGRRHLELFADVVDMELADFAERAYFCGDSEADMDIGSRAGLYTIGVSGTVSDARLWRAGARRIISSVGELLADPR
jgi:phosphoglycolate phosphatase-like HAD superfamily hydrolase